MLQIMILFSSCSKMRANDNASELYINKSTAAHKIHYLAYVLKIQMAYQL